MTLTLYAQPYDLDATGFYFDSLEAYRSQAAKLRNAYGKRVEEFEIQFIDGDPMDCALAEAIGLNQANLAQVFTCLKEWDKDDKLRVILAVGECGYRFVADTLPDDFDLDVYGVESLRELAEDFVAEGLFGEIPERLQPYIDLDAITRDLAVDYTETEIAGERLVYRCG